MKSIFSILLFFLMVTCTPKNSVHIGITKGDILMHHSAPVSVNKKDLYASDNNLMFDNFSLKKASDSLESYGWVVAKPKGGILIAYDSVTATLLFFNGREIFTNPFMRDVKNREL